jgi:protein O-mannosyl-transferase
VLICAGLTALTLAAFWPATRAGFVNIDDSTYIYNNARVWQGLTPENVKWAFSTFYFSNWHPLTWLSYMLDCELFGVDSRAMHCVNLGWHIANVLLLFGLLKRTTGATGSSALVAALFAVHPLHVESVAWISERKDVLSTFFWIASTWAYAEYVKARCAGWYIAALVLCALGLMSKAMLVTLPFALLLFDFWPLRRFELGAPGWLKQLRRLAVEKLPFLILAGVVSYVTFMAQRAGESVIALEPLSLSQRVENVFVSYARYLGKTFWPANLAPFYDHPVEWPLLYVITSLLLLVAISSAAVLHARRWPFLFTGWFWFVGTMVPVIGLVQVGGQSMADRYTYVPHIGLFVALVWAVRHVVVTRAPAPLTSIAVVLVLLICALHTWRQSRYWRDSVALFSHAARVTPPNSVVLNNLGSALLDAGRPAEAERAFNQALALSPNDPYVLGNIANALAREQKLDEALALYERALQFRPNVPELHFNAGLALAKKGQFTNSVRFYERALELDPFYLDALVELGNAQMSLGKTAAAATNYTRVIQLQPQYPAARYNLGQIALAAGRPTDAIEHFSEAIRGHTNFADAYRQLTVALQRAGRVEEARQSLQSALTLVPTNAVLHAELGVLLAQSGRPAEAVSAYRKAIKLDANILGALNNLAWLLATHPSAEIRDGAEAVRLAERAVQLGERKHAFLLGTLGAAYAEAGRFEEAIKSAEEAIQLAERAGQTELVAKNKELLAAYREGRPWREKPSALLDKQGE